MKSFIRILLALSAGCIPSTRAADIGKEGLLLDLEPYYTRRFDATNYNGIGKELPLIKTPVFDGLRFNLNGEFCLWGALRASRGEHLPVAVKGVKVDAAFDELHLVHHGRWSDVEGRTVAKIRLNYVDGSKHEYPILWGHHVRNWAFLPSYEVETMGDPNAKFIWRDPAGDNTQYKGFRRVWETHFMNPHPRRVVKTIDFVSELETATYCVISAVVAKSDSSREETKSIPLGQPKRNFKGSIQVQVTSADMGKPIKDATIQTAVDTKGVYIVAKSLATDEQGKTEFRYWKEETSYVSLQVSAPGHLPVYKSYRGEIPSTASIALRKGRQVGGVVVDDGGKPLAEVSVVLGHGTTVTDKNGKWVLGGQSDPPERDRMTVGRRDLPQRELRIGADVSTEDLFAKKAKIVISAGKGLTGVVRDKEGKPLEGAKVFFGRNTYDKSNSQTLTDKAGKFKFENLPPGENYVTVQGKAKSPEIIPVAIGKQNKPLEVTLGPGFVIKGIVKDSNGKPISGVKISGSRTKDPRTLRIQMTTKANGRFYLGWVPNEPISLTFHKEGLKRHRVTLSPDKKKENNIVLGGIKSVSGKVVDATTGIPVDRFTVQLGRAYSGGQNSFFSRSKYFKDGNFKMTMENTSSSADAVLKISADGYVPRLSRIFSPDSPPRLLKISLKRGKGPEGIVLRPDGKPAGGAQVTASAGSRSVMLRDGRFMNVGSSGAPVIETGSDGRFKMSPQLETKHIVAAHEEGFASLLPLKVTAGEPLKLQPWGSFVGTVTHGGKPLVNEPMGFSYADSRSAPVNLQLRGFPLKTDKNGQVKVDRLPPGEFQLIRFVVNSQSGRTSYRHENTIPVTVEPGKEATASLDLEPQLQSVRGKLSVLDLADADLSKVKITLWSSTLVKPPIGKKIPGPKSRDAAQARAGYMTPKYELYADKTGAFSVADVPTGNYSLSAVLEGESTPGATSPRPLATMSEKVAVVSGGASLDLGEYIALPFLGAGEAAPDFSAEVIDGGKISMSKLRGQYVLLDFWATWCGPCMKETPNLKLVHEEFGNHPKFKMVSLNLDADKAAPRAYAKKHDLKWTNGYLGTWIEQDVTKRFRIYEIPQTMLIGPDGKILARGLRGDAIRKAVAEALKNAE